MIKVSMDDMWFITKMQFEISWMVNGMVNGYFIPTPYYIANLSLLHFDVDNMIISCPQFEALIDTKLGRLIHG